MGAAADNHEEASPLLPPPAADEKQLPPARDPAKGCADGVPVVMGEPVAAPPRETWDTGLLSCLGRNDDFCSSDIEGNFEAFTKQCGCCTGLAEDEESREHLEVACDLATHYFCHPCALCQEGRELRRRVPHPGFNGRSVFVMMPPTEQTMGRAM
ncbi:hypothetical protein QYE76_050105 [Lolium multiflorum]|uniref:Cell number regulator 8 n=1 Tax=Lolium multiflorum TaxID=4521 RepID=A0AAD8WHI2_LOLMU|nr:hypothetical protein QYE76_050105 [Lolium multiflorum]